MGGAAEPLVERVRARMATIRVGDGMDDPDMGPLITREHRDKVRAYIDLGDTDTARSLLQEVADSGDAGARGEAQRLLRELA